MCLDFAFEGFCRGGTVVDGGGDSIWVGRVGEKMDEWEGEFALV
jgi:hypothetical protein